MLDLLSANAAVAFALAVAVGVFGLYLNTRLVRYLKRSAVSSDLRDSDLRGVAGRVVLPIESGRKGRIAVDVQGRRIYLIAVPFREPSTFEVGDSVVVIEMDRGTALVSPFDDIGA